MQNEIKASLPLHNSHGLLTAEGWARHPFWKYDRKAIQAPWYKIKEWDYFSILSADGQYGFCVTFCDLGYLGLMAISFLDLKRGFSHQIDDLVLFPKGQLGLTSDSDHGDIRFSNKKLSIHFRYIDEKRYIDIESSGVMDSLGNKGLKGSIVLTQPKELESINIATSWIENRKAFYYNRKINCMPAEGTISIGNTHYHFYPEKDFGALDWGRGVWTYKNRWFWGSGSGYIQGKSFGFNIGYGFSDRSPASENTLFYEGIAHKIEEVTFYYDEKDYMKPWKFTSSDGRFEMNFQPSIDRAAKINLGILKTNQHQVFGFFSGKAILDDGTVLILDRFAGFAEDVLNWW
jgi:hypothetical protein